ncbi:MAG: hypothetical protein WDO16_13435 [Bacteroidota bacterium]
MHAVLLPYLLLSPVNAAPAVEPITGNPTVCAGNTTQLASITGSGIWSSNNDEEAATVNANGPW